MYNCRLSERIVPIPIQPTCQIILQYNPAIYEDLNTFAKGKAHVQYIMGTRFLITCRIVYSQEVTKSDLFSNIYDTFKRWLNSITQRTLLEATGDMWLTCKTY
jgi:hypothetical protein